MFMTKRRLVFAAASIVILSFLVATTAFDVLSTGESAILFVLWVIVGVVAALYRGLASLRHELWRQTRRLERSVKKGQRRQNHATHADFDGTRQLLEIVYQQTAARLARLELAVDDSTRESTNSVLDAIDERGRITEQLLQATIGLQPAIGARPLPPMRAWAGFSDFQSYLYRLVRAAEPALVVECGSGVSTVVIATALVQIGHGSIVSLEHNEWYANRTRSWLATRDLDACAEVLTAPLGRHEVAPASPWYRHPWIVDDERRIDLLIVDGPPASTGARARYPAVPVLKERLREDCVIVLDDANRDDEREILDAWEELLPQHKVITLPHVKGTGVLFPSDRGSVAQWID